MKQCCIRGGPGGALALAVALWGGGLENLFAQTSNGVLREVYLNIGGTAVSDLTNNPSFPASPSLESIEPALEAPSDFADNYGTRLRALLLPPVTGSYVFYIASDDSSALYLSTDESPATKTLIARVATWTASRVWQEPRDNNNLVQKSVPISLAAGRRYYLEALQKEGTGGDNLAVAWQKPGDLVPANGSAPIPGSNLLAYGLAPPVITQQPANVSVVEGGSATFTVKLQHTIGAVFQWYRGGTNIPNATNASYTLSPLSLADSNSLFFCAITNSLGFTNSVGALLMVLPDTTRPTLSTVGNLGDNQLVFLVFSEPVEALSATNVANYAISSGITVTRASFGIDARTILLTTSPMEVNTTYTLTASNVRDRATTPNTMLPTQQTFSLLPRPIDAAYLSLPREGLGPSSRRHGVVISEVMYHPTYRTDGRDLEFVEIYNAQPWFEELGGWRISGAVDYVFPSNTVLQGRSFLVVAANPTDFRVVYSFTNVFGPFANSSRLQNSSGMLRLRNGRDAIVFEMHYSGDPPYPAAADGTGHSLVLARPSYGEGDPRAWEASAAVGGTPGAAEVFGANSYRAILINEFLAHTALPQVDYIELYNYGNTSVDLAGCILSDDPATNKFIIPTNTVLAPRGFIVFTEDQLGFALSAAGETIFLKHPTGRVVLDAVRFGAQQNGVAMGRYPDGASSFTPLTAPTPGTNNAPVKPSDVVINEIMFDPISGDANDEYLELYNRGTNAVNLAGWHVRDAVSFNIPTDTLIPAGGYLVIGKNAARLRANYAGLTAANCLGDYSGTLANGGERIELNFPDELIHTDPLGQLQTNIIHVTVDEVRYGSGGRWGRWAGGGGSSLELRDARADRRLAPNWADSDESTKSQWVTVGTTGRMDNGWADATQLHLTLLGPGEALVDDVEVIPAGGTNVIANGTFESGAAGWVFQGNHNQSGWESSEGFASSGSLHLRATGRGDSGGNRVRAQLAYTLAPQTTVTLRAKVRWLKGSPNILLRLRGNWLEAPGYTLTTKNLGTPGGPNSRALPNAGPAITGVRHEPALPPANQPVLVLARVDDPDGLAYLAVNYRIDPNLNYTPLAMTNNGAGLFSAVIPAQPAGTSIAFYIQAMDNFAPPASSSFPDDGPGRECLVRWGDNAIPGALPTYRLWLSQTNVSRWAAEEKMSNNPKDLTFIYGANRIIYNAGGWFHGSPYHAPSYDSPTGASCDYDAAFPVDDPLLGDTEINLLRPGNGGGDATAQTEIHGYWFAAQFGLPFLYHRPVFVFVNGQRRETVFHDAQKPNSDFVNEWFPDDADGDLHKIQLGFEFGDQASGASEPGYAVVGADLNRYLTVGGVKKQARYRATWPRRASAADEINDYTNIFNLVEVVMTNAPLASDAYTSALNSAVDVEEWFKVHVTEHLYNNYDSFSYGGGQNAFAYKPERSSWQLLLWDIDFAFGGPANDPNLTSIGGAEHGPRNAHPPFGRIFWQALIEAANGMMTATRSNPILDSRYAGLVASGAAVASPQAIKDFIAARRSFILSQVASNQSPFAITSNGGADFGTNRNLVTLTGTAPLGVRTILVNGIAYPVTWTTLKTWSLRVPLTSGTNTLSITGLDSKGALVAGVSGSLRVTYTGADELPQDQIVINEIMYNPSIAGASYVEIYNASAANAFDLSGWRLDGVDFTFPSGTVLEPGAYKLVVENKLVFAATYGVASSVIGEFSGHLDRGGETLTLIQPGATPAEDRIVDQVTYGDELPWSPAADGGGASLQLIDPRQDNNRVGNWSDGSGWKFFTYTGGVGSAAVTRLSLFFEMAGGDVYLDDFALVFGNTPGVGSNALANGDFETGLGPWVMGSLATNSSITTSLVHSGNASLHLVITPGAQSLTNFYQDFPALIPNTNYTLSFWYLTGGSGTNLNLRLNSLFRPIVNPSTVRFTPGLTNSVRATLPPFPPLWLNEVLPNNFFLGTNGITDRLGDRDPWVELYNGGTNALSLAGYFLANNYTNLDQWPFPSNARIGPKQFLIVWPDGEPGESTEAEFHTSFRIAPDVGSVVLSTGKDLGSVIDYLNYNVPVAGRSYGSFPDGAVSRRRVFSAVTPNATNDPAIAPIEVRINEWMADNRATLADPADGDYEDWFELYNPGTNTVDLGGCSLSDTLTNTMQWRIPAGTTIPGHGYLLVWADGEPAQNTPSRADLHASFSLSKAGEAIALFAPDGAVIDAITFGPQATDVSQGRFPDGAALIYSMTTPTPRAGNFLYPVLPDLRADITRSADSVLISFASVPGRTYRLEYKERLAEVSWIPLGSDAIAGASVLTLSNRMGVASQRFYRVVRVE